MPALCGYGAGNANIRKKHTSAKPPKGFFRGFRKGFRNILTINALHKLIIWAAKGKLLGRKSLPFGRQKLSSRTAVGKNVTGRSMPARVVKVVKASRFWTCSDRD